MRVSKYQVFSFPAVFNAAVATSTSTSAQWHIRNWHTARRLLLLLQGTIRSFSSYLVFLATFIHAMSYAMQILQLSYSCFLNQLHYEAQVDKKMTVSKCLKKKIKMHASSLSKEQEEQLLDVLNTALTIEVELGGTSLTQIVLPLFKVVDGDKQVTKLLLFPPEQSVTCVAIPRSILKASEGIQNIIYVSLAPQSSLSSFVSAPHSI
jgi:hypothetical protein